MKPTIGRVVWYLPGYDRAVINNQPHAAIVCSVNADETVNLSAHDALGNQYPVQGVRMLAPDEPAQMGRNLAMWMPYQVGQAKKTEEAEGALASTVASLADTVASLSVAVAALQAGATTPEEPRGSASDADPGKSPPPPADA